jgi:hypothetical protein
MKIKAEINGIETNKQRNKNHTKNQQNKKADYLKK